MLCSTGLPLSLPVANCPEAATLPVFSITSEVIEFVRKRLVRIRQTAAINGGHIHKMREFDCCVRFCSSFSRLFLIYFACLIRLALIIA
jgi:hypothetical protein